jgi:AcrR family transcriptional regulator
MDRTLSRKERERQFKRREIVDAARVVFAQRGFANATLDEIAEKAEFGKGTLYNYFSSKEELFETVLADGFDEILDIATETCESEETDVRTAYTSFARRLLSYLFTHIPMHALIMREVHKMERNSHFATMFPNLVLLVERPLKRDIEAGRLDGVPTFKVASLFITMVFSLFKTSLNKVLEDCSPEQSAAVTLPPDQVHDLVQENLDVLQLVFFTGLFCTNSRKHASEHI